MLTWSSNATNPPSVKFSPLILADRLITLAQEADRAGYSNSASRLISAAYAALDEDKASVPSHGDDAQAGPSSRVDASRQSSMRSMDGRPSP